MEPYYSILWVSDKFYDLELWSILIGKEAQILIMKIKKLNRADRNILAHAALIMQ